MIRIAVCDDDKYICSAVENMILDYQKQSSIKIAVEVFYKGEDLISYIKNEHQFDLIFLDIELGTTTGIDVGIKIRNELDDHVSKIVFVSSKDGYDRQLFAVQPLNFIKKPIDRDQTIKCIELAMKILNRDNSYFEYKFKKAMKKVNCKDILYFQSSLKKIKIITFDSEDEFYGSLEEMKHKLPISFISPHASYVINFSCVNCIAKNDLYMINGDKIPISQKKLKNVREFFIEFEKERRDARL